MNSKYYISTGAKNNFYTLRYTFDEAGHRSCGDGLAPEIITITRDYHVQNLSTDRSEAIAKARAITGKGLDASFEVLPIGERRAVDWSVFQGGKYEGKSIHEVLEIDREYIIYMIENCGMSERYRETLDMARAIVADELSARAITRAKESARAARRSARAACLLAPLAAIMRGMPGDFCASIAEGMEQGSAPRGRGAAIALDIIAKASGRRNSKGYESAYDQASRRFNIATRLA